jgi:FkbM family methyltransferase
LSLLRWLFTPPSVRILPIIDSILLVLSKLTYLAARVTLRVLLGRRRRDNLKLTEHLRRLIRINTSFYAIYYLCEMLHKLGIRWPRYVKLTVNKYGYTAYCPLNKHDFIDLTVREEELIELFAPKDGDIVIDIGAHTGRYTIISANRVGPNGKVISIEPDIEMFKVLKRNLDLNSLSNVLPLNYAVYSRNTRLKLYVASQPAESSIFNTTVLERAENKELFFEVQARTLDNLLLDNGIPPEEVNWVKIDVEGAEYEVLKGSVELLTKGQNIQILIEIHNIASKVNSYQPISELLFSHRFKIDFEHTYLGGEKHIIASRRPTRQTEPFYAL